MHKAGSKQFGVVIAERRLTVRGPRPKNVTVALGKPRLARGERDWECPFRITGGGIRVLERGYGVDAMQAIQNALQGVRTCLDESGHAFEWLGMRMDDGGFARAIPWFGDSRFTRRMERLIEVELERYAATQRRRYAAEQRRRQSKPRRTRTSA